MKRSFVICALALLVLPIWAQREIEVVKKGEGKIGINLSGYRTGSDNASRTFLSVLKADLNRSGYFTVTSSGGAVNVAGSCVSGGSQMKADCQVFNAATRQRYLGKTYEAMDRLDLAEEIFREIPIASPSYAGGSISLALFLARRERWEEAESVFLESFPRMPAWIRSGLANNPDAELLFERPAVKAALSEEE